ncbi:MAG: recombinase family protein [Pseudomonadales bacterium]
MPICYPYIRFSSMKQADGDSIRRQAARIDEFVQRHKLSIDTRLEDHGVSSFRGKNVKSGQLAGFLQRVRDGEIDKGSYLLIENWDRLSRQVLDASLELFSDLIRAGIKIAVLDEGTVYDDLTSNSYIRAIVHFERAHDESLRKSDMSKANWKAKHREMEKGVIVTKKIPNWLKIENDSFVVIEDIAEQIREMFKLSLAYGLSEVGRMLNERYDSKWKTHQIQYMLKNKRVIGWHVPVVYSKENGKNITTDSLFADYYPPIIEADIFDQVQTIIKSRKPFSGRSDIQKFNIYRDLIVCSECGGNVRFMLKKSQNGDKEYYYCTNSMSDACTTKGLKSVRGEHLRKVLFKYEHWTNISSFFSQHDHATKALKETLHK